MVKKEGIQLFFYARYADDMLFGIPKGLCKEAAPSGSTLSKP
jgi:hypothetical protein